LEIEAYRLADAQEATLFSDAVTAALDGAGITYRSTGSSSVISGGAPEHDWITVMVAGSDAMLRVVAATEAELRVQLQQIAEELSIPTSSLDARPPSGWPRR
jgi:hypothetical protein